jgi:hypothetical protein
VGTVLALVLATGSAPIAHAAISFHTGQLGSGLQAQDPGAAPGETVALNFNSSGMPQGFTQINGAAGTWGLNTGSVSGVAAEPSGDTSQYFYVGTGGVETFLFPTAVSTTSFYWGSVDDYNYVQVLGGAANAPVVLATISGFQAVGASASSRHFGQSLRLYIADSASSIIGLRFLSYGQSFEIDNIAISQPPGLQGVPGPILGAPVPEPATWATMILGLGAVGAIARSRRKATNAIAA